jgi:signal transduction histidine kinase
VTIHGQSEMAPPPAVDRDDAARLSPIRAAAVIVLVAQLVFMVLELRFTAKDAIAAHLVIYAISGTLTLVVFLASYTGVGERNAGAVAVAMCLGLTGTTLGFFWLTPEWPMLVAHGLSCLLIGATVLLLWSIERTALISGIVLAGFAIVGWLRVPPTVLPGSYAFASAALAMGAAIALACATILGRVRGNLAGRQRELSDLSARLMSVQEEERQRLSRELHDELGQSLTAVLSYLWLVERGIPGHLEELRTRTAEARRLASKTLAQIRELSQLLRPSVLDDYGLVPSLDAHVKAFADRQQLLTSFTADPLPHRLSSDIETAVYRITQEALTNVARHAHANTVRVTLGVEGRELRLEVEDDGVGLPSTGIGGRSTNGGGMGLIGIRERVRALGGTLTLGSDGGTRLEVRLPLPADAV